MSRALIDQFGDEAGSLREPLVAGEYAVPNDIRINKNNLVWRNNFSLGPPRIVKPKARVLPEFLELGEPDIPDAKILSYAQKWGILNLCKEHLMPASHAPRLARLRPSDKEKDKERLISHVLSCEPAQSEPLSEWRFLARQMSAFLKIAISLERDKKLGGHEDWQVLRGEDYYGEFVPGRDLRHWKPGWRGDLSEAKAIEKNHIASFINLWLQMGGVYPRAEWRGEGISLTLEGSPNGKLFGALAIQLMQEAGRCTFLFCRNCRKTFTPKTRQSRYCPTCQKADVPKQRAADRRNRKLGRSQ